MHHPSRSFAVLPLTLLVASACASQPDDLPGARSASSAVVGGLPASASDYPSTVAITDPAGDPFCSGTLIAPHVVVTAAHCLVNQTESDLRVIYGFTTPASAPPSERRTVAMAAPHPHYDPSAPKDAYGLGPLHDIGVIVLDDDIAGAVVTPVLPYTRVDAELTPSRPLHIVGYGINNTTTNASGTLFKAITPHVRHAPTELLAGRPGTPDTCFGDSGGPAYLVDDDTLWLVGATSRAWDGASEPCGESTVYTVVSAYVPWLESMAGELDGGAVEGGFSGAGWDADAPDAAMLDGNPSCVPLDSVCHPVTNEGCEAGEACVFDPATSRVRCRAGDNDTPPAKMCDQTARFCMPGFYCGASIRCEKLCCSDADCPDGVSCTPLITLLGDLGTCGPVDVPTDAGLDADAGLEGSDDAATDGEAADDADAADAPNARADASVDGADSEADAGDDFVPPEAIFPETGACGCTTAGSRERSYGWLTLLAWVVLAGTRRKRSQSSARCARGR